MEQLSNSGSTAEILLESPGVVLKRARACWLNADEATVARVRNNFRVEREIYELLGRHSNIVQYLGGTDTSIKLAYANCGNLQEYIDCHHAEMDTETLWALAHQLATALAYLHAKGCRHQDLRLENCLLNIPAISHDAKPSPKLPRDAQPSLKLSRDAKPFLELYLSDFGGSQCEERNLDGEQIPDEPFGDPRLPSDQRSPAMDIFGFGSILYTILNGYWPYRSSPPPQGLERYDFQEKVKEQIMKGNFPDVSRLEGGFIIQKCWDHEFETAEELLRAVDWHIQSLPDSMQLSVPIRGIDLSKTGGQGTEDLQTLD